jgi:hypothetical protein
MGEVNRITTPANMRWKLVDRETGAENADIDWRFRVGDQVKIRLLNEMAGDHPMHHPFHVHGAGRFLVLSRDGVVEPNLVWKDTVLIRTGQTVDILLDITNPACGWPATSNSTRGGMMFLTADPRRRDQTKSPTSLSRLHRARLVGPYEISRWPEADVHFLARTLDLARGQPRSAPARPYAPRVYEDKKTTRNGASATTSAPWASRFGDRVVWQGTKSGARPGRNRWRRRRPQSTVASSQSLQLLIEYDPQPPFDSGAPRAPTPAPGSRSASGRPAAAACTSCLRPCPDRLPIPRSTRIACHRSSTAASLANPRSDPCFDRRGRG